MLVDRCVCGSELDMLMLLKFWNKIYLPQGIKPFKGLFYKVLGNIGRWLPHPTGSRGLYSCGYVLKVTSQGQFLLPVPQFHFKTANPVEL